MHEKLEKKARKKVEAKMGFYVVATIFASLSVILLVISFYASHPASFWLRFPILIFGMVLAIIYVSVFGFPFSRVMSEEWKEEEYEKELYRLYRQKRLPPPPPEDLSEQDQLELKELERLKKKWEPDEDYYV
jgi:hypothetical protein